MAINGGAIREAKDRTTEPVDFDGLIKSGLEKIDPIADVVWIVLDPC